MLVAMMSWSLACGNDEPARDASDLTQFPAADAMPPVQPAPRASEDALWPDASAR